MSLPWMMMVDGVATYYVIHGTKQILEGIDDIKKKNEMFAGVGKVGCGIAVVGFGSWLGKVASMKPQVAYKGMIKNLDPYEGEKHNGSPNCWYKPNKCGHISHYYLEQD